MRMIKILFHPLGFYTLRGCCCYSFPKAWRPRSKVSNTREELDASTDIDVESPPPWDKLPRDILQLITERLDLDDRIRLDVVCKGWRSERKQSSQLLWLMLPYDKDKECQYLTFFDFCGSKVRKVKLPESAQGGWFCGSSKGWLFLAKGSSKHNLQTFLFDPISLQQILLPPLPKLVMSKLSEKKFMARRSHRHLASCIVNQVAVSSSDASQCVVAARFLTGENLLAICRPQDERWTIVEGLLPEESMHLDILFSGDGRKLYAIIAHKVLENNNGGPLQAHSVTLSAAGHDHDHLNLILIPAMHPTLDSAIYAAAGAAEPGDEEIWYLQEWWVNPRLVESNGELLLVTRIGDQITTWDYDDPNENNYLFNYYQTTRFEVLKIQIAAEPMMSSTMARVNNLDNQSLFFGYGVGLAWRFDGGMDKNCIYFLEDFDYGLEKEYPLLSRDSGVFYLNDGRIKRSFPSVRTEKLNYMTWFSPNINFGNF